MKKTAIGIAAVLTGFTTVAYSVPKDHTWYNGAKIGWSQYHDTGYYGNGYLNTDGPTRATQLGAGAFLGYQSTPYLGFELGYDWLGRMAYKGSTINGALKAQGVQLAAKLNFPLNNRWDLYTRVGGMVWRVDTTQNNLIDDLNITHISHHDTGFSPLASVGIEYAINKNWATRLDYQWTNNIGNATTVGTRPDNGTVSIGISYRFGQDQNEETVHTVIPATVTTPVVKPKHFTLKSDVLFNFNKSTLKQQGQKTLDKLYDQLQSMDSKDGTIVVIGFADRIGSSHYNQKLSERRSQSVVEYLVSKGIPYNKISASGMGEANSVTGSICNNIKNRNSLIKCLAPDRRVEINVQGIENVVT